MQSDTVFAFDEPTIGQHLLAERTLLKTFRKLIVKGSGHYYRNYRTRLDVIRNADYIIDMEPCGGESGGGIIASGTHEEVKCASESDTAKLIYEQTTKTEEVKMKNGFQVIDIEQHCTTPQTVEAFARFYSKTLSSGPLRGRKWVRLTPSASEKNRSKSWNGRGLISRRFHSCRLRNFSLLKSEKSYAQLPMTGSQPQGRIMMSSDIPFEDSDACVSFITERDFLPSEQKQALLYDNAKA